MSFETIINYLSGQFGLYQALSLFFLGIYVQTANTIHVFIPVFAEYRQEYNCSSFYNESNYLSDGCEVWENSTTLPPVKCDQWQFDQSIFKSTVRSQYGLVCSWEWQVSLGSTALMLGRLLGGFMFGILADRYGRLSMMIVAGVLQGVPALCCAFVPYFWAYCCLRFIIGCATGGLYMIVPTYLSEIAPASKRILYLMVCFCGYGISGIILTAIAYFQREHHLIQIICAALWIVVIFYPILFVESPRWLAVKGYTKRSLAACKKISKINRREFVKDENFISLCKSLNMNQDNKKVSLWQTFRYPGLRSVTLATWYCLCVSGFTYYMINLGSGTVGNNVFLSFGLMSLLDLPFRLLGYGLSVKFGRIKILVSQFLIAGISIMISGILYDIPGAGIAVVVFSLIARCSISITLDLMWVYQVDIFPTVARSSLAGIGSTLSGLIGTLSPQMENLINVWTPLPFLLSGLLSVIAGLLCWRYMPETYRMTMKDQLDEAEQFIQKSKYAFCSRDCFCCKVVDDLHEIEVELFEIKQ